MVTLGRLPAEPCPEGLAELVPGAGAEGAGGTAGEGALLGDPTGESRGEFWRLWEGLGQETAPSRSASTAENMEP